MSLMTFVRSIVAIAIVCTILAIGIGASGVRLPEPESSAPLSCEPPLLDAMAASWPIQEGHYLVDRSNGRKTAIRLPEGDRWAIVSVSPWRGPDGELEAVGRWVRCGDEDFCGWGLFRLSDGAVLSRVAADILPLGRPCWVPGRGRTMLFSAADGRIHRCRLAARGDEGADGDVAQSGFSRPKAPVPVSWAVRPPGSGDVFLSDPVWSHDPRLKKWVIVCLSQQGRVRGKLIYGQPKLWWLELNDSADGIVAAGQLRGTAGSESGLDGPGERYPNLAIGPRGEIRLVYLTRSYKEKLWRLRSAELEFEPGTGRPLSVAEDRPAGGPRDGIEASPMLISVDGRTVYTLSGSGRVDAVPLSESAEADPGKTPAEPQRPGR